MGVLKRNDFIVETDKKGRYVRTILPPQRSLIPDYKIVNGKQVMNGYKVAPKGYFQPSHVDGTNNEIADFGRLYARRFRHNKCKRRYH